MTTQFIRKVIVTVYILLPRQHHCRKEMRNILVCIAGLWPRLNPGQYGKTKVFVTFLNRKKTLPALNYNPNLYTKPLTIIEPGSGCSGHGQCHRGSGTESNPLGILEPPQCFWYPLYTEQGIRHPMQNSLENLASPCKIPQSIWHLHAKLLHGEFGISIEKAPYSIQIIYKNHFCYGTLTIQQALETLITVPPSAGNCSWPTHLRLSPALC